MVAWRGPVGGNGVNWYINGSLAMVVWWGLAGSGGEVANGVRWEGESKGRKRKKMATCGGQRVGVGETWRLVGRERRRHMEGEKTKKKAVRWRPAGNSGVNLGQRWASVLVALWSRRLSRGQQEGEEVAYGARWEGERKKKD